MWTSFGTAFELVSLLHWSERGAAAVVSGVAWHGFGARVHRALVRKRLFLRGFHAIGAVRDPHFRTKSIALFWSLLKEECSNLEARMLGLGWGLGAGLAGEFSPLVLYCC